MEGLTHTLRPATFDDAELLFALRNDPVARAASRNTGLITPAEHTAWLQSTLASADRHILIAELSGHPVGQVRFDRQDHRYEISVSLDGRVRGRGLGSRVIVSALQWLLKTRPETRVIEAHIRRCNAVSLAAFERAGFDLDPTGGDGDFLRLLFTVPDRSGV